MSKVCISGSREHFRIYAQYTLSVDHKIVHLLTMYYCNVMLIITSLSRPYLRFTFKLCKIRDVLIHERVRKLIFLFDRCTIYVNTLRLDVK